jgi:hypothetical protein
MGPRGRMHVQACLCTLGAGTGGAVLWRPRLRNGCIWWGPHNLPHFSRMPGGIDVRPDLWPGPRTPAKVQSPGSSQRSCPKSMPPGRRKIEVYLGGPHRAANLFFGLKIGPGTWFSASNSRPSGRSKTGWRAYFNSPIPNRIRPIFRPEDRAISGPEAPLRNTSGAQQASNGPLNLVHTASKPEIDRPG